MSVAFKRKTALLFAFFVFLLSILPSLALSLLILTNIVDLDAHVIPSYEKVDLTPFFLKDVWSNEDFDTLRHQTGLSKTVLADFQAEKKFEELLKFQEALFYECTVVHTDVESLTPHCIMQNYTAPMVPLEDGDIIVTASCHTLGWKNGHAAIVINAKLGSVLEAVSPGYPSRIGAASWFKSSANFIVLRLKDADLNARKEIAKWAANTLLHVDYSLFVGFLSPKDQGETPQQTHCSHLVWQAYQHFGYNIDYDGGPLASCKDISRSPLLEKVQIYGFDVDRAW